MAIIAFLILSLVKHPWAQTALPVWGIHLKSTTAMLVLRVVRVSQGKNNIADRLYGERTSGQ